ncbi:MAG: flagellar motor switch protein FliG [Candidatus Latescibacteria bacterium]|jgi:flagellar motor switch protein FliG|nr:flagellar motor switch protein FliG [Candidatus Latescibacterota bacterium]
MLEPTRSKSKTYEELTSIEKSAIILIALGREASAEVMRHLSEDEIEVLTITIARTENISPEVELEVLREYYAALQASEFVSEGGIDFAREMLEGTLGKQRADEMLKKIQQTLNPTGFSLLKDVDPIHLLEFIRTEHPQTIALILSQLNAGQAAQVLSQLPEDIQTDVSMRIATMEKISPEVINEIESVLDIHLKEVISGNLSASGGVKSIAEILNLVDRSAEKSILGNMEMENPELASNIKNLMFVFDDLAILDDRSIQLVLKEVDIKELAIALKASSDEMQEKIFKNVSDRVAEMIKEEMDYAGPTRLSVVEESQQRIVEVVRRLEEEQQIVIVRGGAEGGEVFV